MTTLRETKTTDKAKDAFARAFQKDGISGFRKGANTASAELQFRKLDLTRVGFLGDFTGSRVKTLNQLVDIISESAEVFSSILGNTSIEMMSMSGGNVSLPQTFEAHGIRTGLEQIQAKDGSTDFIRAIELLKIRQGQLEQEFGDVEPTYLGAPGSEIEIREEHPDIDFLIVLADCFEDKRGNSSLPLNTRYKNAAQEFLAHADELGIPVFVLHEKTRMYYKHLHSDNFDALDEVLIPLSVGSLDPNDDDAKIKGGSYYSYEVSPSEEIAQAIGDQYRNQIMGFMTSVAVIMLGKHDKEIVKEIMKDPSIKDLIESGDLDLGILDQITAANPPLQIGYHEGPQDPGQDDDHIIAL